MNVNPNTPKWAQAIEVPDVLEPFVVYEAERNLIHMDMVGATPEQKKAAWAWLKPKLLLPDVAEEMLRKNNKPGGMRNTCLALFPHPQKRKDEKGPAIFVRFLFVMRLGLLL